MLRRSTLPRAPRRAPAGWWPAAVAALTLALPAGAAERHWSFIGACAAADWFGPLAPAGSTTCWSAGPLLPAVQPLPTAADDVRIERPDATAPALVTFADASRSAPTGFARDLRLSGNSRYAVGLEIARGTLTVQTLQLRLAGQSAKGQLVQSGGSFSALQSASVHGGTLSMTDGSFSTPQLRLAEGAGSAASLRLDGRAQLAASAFVLGGAGSADVQTTSGALTTDDFQAATSATGRAKLAMDGMVWTHSGLMQFGVAGQSDLALGQGTQVRASAGTAYFGVGAGSRGGLVLRDADTRFTVGTLVLGVSGAGAAEVGAGSTLDTWDATLGLKAGGGGELTVGSATPGSTASFMAGNSLQVGGQGTGLLTVLANGRVDAPRLAVGRTGTLVLDGGYVRTSALALAPGGRFTWRSGTLETTTQFAAMDDVSLPRQLDVRAGSELRLNLWLTLGDGAKLTLDGGTLAGFRNDRPNLRFAGSGSLAARGTFNVAVYGGGPESRITALGDLEFRQAGFVFGGLLDVGAHQVTVFGDYGAALGVQTRFAEGGRLVLRSGAVLGAGGSLLTQGAATIEGSLQMDGEAFAPTGSFTFLGPVAGAGQFAGDVRFAGPYAPGNGVAEIAFGGGDVHFDAGALLTMQLEGTVLRSGYDRLVSIGTLHFDGTLVLDFGPGFAADGGATLALLEYGAFEGRLDADRVVVHGFDAARLDLSRLATDGTLVVTAVPEPASAALLLAGGALLVARRRAQAGSSSPSSPLDRDSKP